MSRFILLSSFVLAFVSVQAAFTPVSADPVSSTKGIVLKRIDRNTVIGNHPESGVVDSKTEMQCGPSVWPC